MQQNKKGHSRSMAQKLIGKISLQLTKPAISS